MTQSPEDPRRLKTILVEQAIKTRAQRHHLRAGAEKYIAADLVDKLKVGAHGGFRHEAGGDLDDVLDDMRGKPEHAYHFNTEALPASSRQDRLKKLSPSELLAEANRLLHPRGGK